MNAPEKNFQYNVRISCKLNIAHVPWIFIKLRILIVILKINSMFAKYIILY